MTSTQRFAPVPHAPTRPRTPALSVQSLSHRYGDTPVLHHVGCHVPRGGSVALMGPSGSGKTTLLHAMAGILTPSQGQVVATVGHDVVEVSALGLEERARLRRTGFGLVFQSGQLLGELTAAENVALPLLLDGGTTSEAMDRARTLFAPLGLDGLHDRRPGELSGGQQQRVAIARALVTGPSVIFADEPTGALDRRMGEEVMSVLLDAQLRVGAALVLVTHDAEVAARCDTVLELRDGRIAAVTAGGAS